MRRPAVKAPIAAVLLLGLGASALMALPSGAAEAVPAPLYFHSATGKYQDDVAADPSSAPGGKAPEGSTLTPAVPTLAEDSTATATSRDHVGLPGSPISPTFPMPETGTVTSLCLDLWVEATPGTKIAARLFLQTQNDAAARSGNTFAILPPVEIAYTEGIVRLTGLVKPAEPYELAPETTLSFLIDASKNQDFTLHYDSLTRYSSIIINPDKDKCVAAPLPVDDEEESGEEPSEAPSEEPSEEPIPDPTPVPSVSPSPSVPAGQETHVSYTGATTARYADLLKFAATVTNDLGRPVSGGTMSFVLGRTTYSAPVRSGRAEITGRVNEVPETYLLETRYSGTTGYRSSATQDGLVVTKAQSVCSLQRGASATASSLIAVLSRVDSSRIPNVPVTFLHQNRSVGSARADSRGVARIDTAPRGRAGDVFSASFAGDRNHLGCRKDLRI